MRRTNKIEIILFPYSEESANCPNGYYYLYFSQTENFMKVHKREYGARNEDKIIDYLRNNERIEKHKILDHKVNFTAIRTHDHLKGEDRIYRVKGNDIYEFAQEIGCLEKFHLTLNVENKTVKFTEKNCVLIACYIEEEII